jgi:hypothetical protein
MFMAIQISTVTREMTEIGINQRKVHLDSAAQTKTVAAVVEQSPPNPQGGTQPNQTRILQFRICGSEHTKSTPNPTSKPAKSNTQQARITGGGTLASRLGAQAALWNPAAVREKRVGELEAGRVVGGDKPYASKEKRRRAKSRPTFIRN